MSNQTTTTMMMTTCPPYDADDYECADRGLLLPFVSEATWAVEARAVIYLIGLLWCFLGIAIVADIFMCAIEKITSTTRTINVANPESEKGYVEVEVEIWNGTVANLTLMALGSSAPEILLSCIEIVKEGFRAGDLGPSTIVGSAAFNLLVITAVCIIAIPEGETRIIKSIKVFATTATFSIFAYIWLLIILVVSTPNYVELWEAIMTFLFFPALVVLAFVADKDYCGRKKPMTDEETPLEISFSAPDNRITTQGMRDLVKELRSVNPNLNEEQIAKLAAAKSTEETSHSHLWYRINAVRKMGGNPTLYPSFDDSLLDVSDHLREHEEGDIEDEYTPLKDESEGNTKAVIEFTASQSAILESDKRVKIAVRRYGKTNCRVIFKVDTVEGSAKADEDYKPFHETMVFEKEDVMKRFEIAIIDDNEWEPDELFFVKLSIDPQDDTSRVAKIGRKSVQEVTIINDDEPGVFGFEKACYLFKESSLKAIVPVVRTNGADGRITLQWKTTDITATDKKDYLGGEGSITFEHGETSKTIEIEIIDDQVPEKDESFGLEITKCPEGAKLGNIKYTVVTIVNDDEFNNMLGRLVDVANGTLDSLRVDSNTWADQFRNAMNVNGGDLESATNIDYLMHFLTFGWKIIFAMIPPPSIWGGWLAFGIALAFIGLVTAIVGDLAAIFGCLVGLKDSVTAITLVALGTSLPDLFASKQAAIQEKTADNSIGNVTGSNSVNVFLGLGLPWLIASIYWSTKGETFEVPAGALSFSVIIYTITAICCVALLMVRRNVAMFGGELGGAVKAKYVSAAALVFLWLMYITLSTLQAYGVIEQGM